MFMIKNDSYKLDGIWKFVIDKDKVGKKEKWYEHFPVDADKMVVPSCWNTDIKYFGFIGDAWYQTTVEFFSENILIKFLGVLNSCEVYLDGKLKGEYYGSFGEYDLLIENVSRGTHTLTVLVNDETNDLDTIPRTNLSWYHYGGLFRSVEVVALKDVYIKNVKCINNLNNEFSKSDTVIKAEVKNLSGKVLPYKLIFNGEVVSCGENRFDSKETEISFEVKDFELWCAENPKLYNVELIIGDTSYNFKTGFRKFEIKDGKFYLNGKRFIFRGFNRHEEHPDFGFALPCLLNKRDIDIIKSANANFVRFSHYPVNTETLDYCDEIGMMVWEEIPLWEAQEDSLKTELLTNRALAMHTNMVERDINHPCVCVWGLHNEIDTRCGEGVELTKKMYELNKRLDGSRIITYATMYGETDKSFKFCDFISLNKYIGWYQNGGEKEWDKYFDLVHENMLSQGVEDKPVIVSEFGIEGIQGETSFYGLKWLENTQEQVVNKTVRYFYERKDIQGVLYWQFCDTRESVEFELKRARCYNNKGAVNEFRQPKLLYYTIKKIFEEISRR